MKRCEGEVHVGAQISALAVVIMLVPLSESGSPEGQRSMDLSESPKPKTGRSRGGGGQVTAE